MRALLRWIPAPASIGRRERIRVCIGALLGIGITGALTHWLLPNAGDLPLLIAPMGASAVLLFAVPASPLAQPWSLLGGNMIAALIGVTCARWVGDPVAAAALAVSVAIGAMIVTRCVHPPAGAVALTAVLGGETVRAAGYGFALVPVGINSLVMLLMAMAYHRATGHRYPHAPPAPAVAPDAQRGFAAADLDAALKDFNEILDIDRGDLEQLLRRAEQNAFRRRFGAVACADIMSPAVVTVEFGSSLEEAWSLLRRHRIKALPVIDKSQRVIGIVTRADFMQHAQLDHLPGIGARLRDFVARITTLEADRPEVVGQIMSAPVQTAPAAQPIADLVPLFAASGHHHIPIVDAEQRLVGIVTQSDLIAALYEKRLLE